MKCILLHTGRGHLPVGEPRPNHDEVIVNQPAEQQENEALHDEVVHLERGENTLPTTYQCVGTIGLLKVTYQDVKLLYNKAGLQTDNLSKLMGDGKFQYSGSLVLRIVFPNFNQSNLNSSFESAHN